MYKTINTSECEISFHDLLIVGGRLESQSPWPIFEQIGALSKTSLIQMISSQFCRRTRAQDLVYRKGYTWLILHLNIARADLISQFYIFQILTNGHFIAFIITMSSSSSQILKVWFEWNRVQQIWKEILRSIMLSAVQGYFGEMKFSIYAKIFVQLLHVS